MGEDFVIVVVVRLILYMQDMYHHGHIQISCMGLLKRKVNVLCVSLIL